MTKTQKKDIWDMQPNMAGLKKETKNETWTFLVLLSLIPLDCALFSHYMNEFVWTFWKVFLLPTHVGGLGFPLTKVARVLSVDLCTTEFLSMVFSDITD
jgi:hypothetical protein